jgi:hypothetical protein
MRISKTPTTGQAPNRVHGQPSLKRTVTVVTTLLMAAAFALTGAPAATAAPVSTNHYVDGPHRECDEDRKAANQPHAVRSPAQQRPQQYDGWCPWPCVWPCFQCFCPDRHQDRAVVHRAKLPPLGSGTFAATLGAP